MLPSSYKNHRLISPIYYFYLCALAALILGNLIIMGCACYHDYLGFPRVGSIWTPNLSITMLFPSESCRCFTGDKKVIPFLVCYSIISTHFFSWLDKRNSGFFRFYYYTFIMAFCFLPSALIGFVFMCVWTFLILICFFTKP